jgi:hypothetical protein
MGIAIAWRRGDDLPTLRRLRELAAEVAESTHPRSARANPG